jgi:hypothetical protein
MAKDGFCVNDGGVFIQNPKPVALSKERAFQSIENMA